MSNTNLKVLQLESEIRKMRIDLVDKHLLNSGINPVLYNEADKMSIYSMLEMKAEKFKQENLDKCI